MAHSRFSQLAIDQSVAVITLDDPDRSANLLSSAVLDELEAHFDALDGHKAIRGLVIHSAKPGMFIAGANLDEFAAGLDHAKKDVVATSRRGQLLFKRLAEAAYVSVAAIDGICVGGGAELAMWCDRRIATHDAKTQIGFPEVKLGLYPGWGGTVRTPRIIGLSNAVELVTGGENVGALEAAKLGLVDELVPSGDDLLAAAKRMIAAERESQQYKADRQRWAGPIDFNETELGFLGATAAAVIQQQTKGNYPAPMEALEVLLEGSQMPADAALELEADKFAPLFGSPVNRGLLNVFFLTDRAKKQSPGGKSAFKASQATVLGAGTMGQGIAAANLKRGIDVILSDARPEALSAGISSVVREASYNRETKGTDADKAVEMAGRIDAATMPVKLASADVVIEAIYEDADAKRKLFAELEPHAADTTILCSNTSTIPITDLARDLKRPERFCGLHFFNPVRRMPLVEVIRGEKTSDETVAAMVAYSRRLKKTPVVIADGPGFLVNRLLGPYMAEAALMASESVPIRAIESAAKQFGMPMGPLTLHDVVGLDVCLHGGRVMAAAFPDRVPEVPIIEQLVAAERLGQKNGKGFFDYPPAKPGRTPRGNESTEVVALIEGLAVGNRGGDDPNREYELIDRLMLPMLLEATRAIEDGIVDDVRDVDLALVLGIGFPPFRGGLFFWADTLGAEAIIEKLKPLKPLGKRFEATKMLKDHAKTGKPFYPRA